MGTIGQSDPIQCPRHSFAKLARTKPMELPKAFQVFFGSKVRINGQFLRDDPQMLQCTGEWIGFPSKVTEPLSGRTRPQIVRIRVVLPAPLGPSNAKRSPGRTSNERPRKASFEPNFFRMPSTLRTALNAGLSVEDESFVGVRRDDTSSAAQGKQKRGFRTRLYVRLHSKGM